VIVKAPVLKAESFGSQALLNIDWR